MDDTIKLLEEMRDRKSKNGVLFLAIDGRCAAGKTTLAEKLEMELQKEFKCNIFHMDDFFLQPVQRTVSRLEEPGGNVDYERFEREILQPLKAGRKAQYQPYSCHEQRLLSASSVFLEEINIVEGSYSCHPTLWDYYDLHVFVTIDKQEQIRRIRERNGAKKLPDFQKRWIPLEEKYFEACQIENRCQFRLSGETIDFHNAMKK